MGERNVAKFPFHGDTTHFILYHHENADGSGPFGKTSKEICVQSHIIHLADILDMACHFHEISEDHYERIQAFLEQQRDVMFTADVIGHFYMALSKEQYMALRGRDIDELLNEELPHDIEEYPFEQVRAVMDVFGRIVDYKSPFTRSHSDHIAHRIQSMSDYYGYDRDIQERLYVAGALHDIGKMAIKNDILEKPGKLTNVEYVQMQNHAWYTYLILSKVNGFEDITEWAALHHEKLNGKGYPFGKNAEQLSRNDRLMACVDIYQALREDRPYKQGMPHEKCIEIMRNMVTDGFIDHQITEDINTVFCEKEL